MAFFKKKKNDSWVSPGTTGYRIKSFREMRKLSQKEFGIKCGLPAASADVRVSQYETNKQVPRDKEFLKVLAKALDLDEYAIFDFDLSPFETVKHVLFELEDLYGLRPCCKDGFYYLKFDYDSGKSWQRYSQEIYPFLQDWYEMRKRYLPTDGESEDEKEERLIKYKLCKGEYPIQVNQKKAEYSLVNQRMAELQMEMDSLNTLKEDSVIKYEGLKEKVNSIIPKVSSQCPSVKKLSDLVKFIIDMMENKLPIKGMFVDGRFAHVYPRLVDCSDFISLKINDISDSEENTINYAKTVYVIRSLQAFEIPLEERLTSLNNELYITYSCPYSEGKGLDRIMDSWGDLTRVVEDGLNNGFDGHYIQIKDKFLEAFKNEHDTSFSN